MRRMHRHDSSRLADHTASAARGFTLVEVLVTTALLTIAMVATVEIFTVTSDATARTTANSDVIRKATAVREVITSELNRMAPGLLIIESPAPTLARAEAEGGKRFVRLNHHRLVFLTHGEIDAYQSFTDPTRGTPAAPAARQTATSSEALVYIGPGTPLNGTMAMPVDDPANPYSTSMTASQWVFQHRSILLMNEVRPGTDPAWTPTTMAQVNAAGGMLDGGNLRSELLDGSMDAIISDTAANGLRASTKTFISLIQQKALDATDLLSPTPSIAALWKPSFAPRNATLQNTTFLNYYTRSGSNFIPGLADFRIEWTDGSVDLVGPDGSPNTGDEGTRWFGLRPDPNYNVTVSDLQDIENDVPPTIPYIAKRRQDYTNDTRSDEAVVFGIAPGSQNMVEWSANGNSPGVNSAYRAIWRPETWNHRPKALRFTYRIYDEGNRLTQREEVDLDEDGDFDPDDGATDQFRGQLRRFGRTFSVVVPLP